MKPVIPGILSDSNIFNDTSIAGSLRQQGVYHTPSGGLIPPTFAQHSHRLHILITPLLSHRGVLNIIFTFANYCMKFRFSGKSLNCCHQMSDFKAKMHQIQFWLELRPRPRWRSLQRSPDPLAAGFKRPTSKGGRKGKEGERGRGGRGKGRGEEKGREWTPKGWLTPPMFQFLKKTLCDSRSSYLLK